MAHMLIVGFFIGLFIIISNLREEERAKEDQLIVTASYNHYYEKLTRKKGEVK